MKSYEQIARAMWDAYLKERKSQGSTGTDYLRWKTSRSRAAPAGSPLREWRRVNWRGGH